jgi:UDP:flavonoid glycosyltransferase YjiC (YdhE family)
LLSPSSNYTNSSKKTPDRPLHITCLTIGSRGDVQPYLALCKELKKDGHTCRIATHPEYQGWVEEHGLEFRSIGGDPGDLMV